MLYVIGAYLVFVGAMLVFAFLIYRRGQQLKREREALQELEREQQAKKQGAPL